MQRMLVVAPMSSPARLVTACSRLDYVSVLCARLPAAESKIIALSAFLNQIYSSKTCLDTLTVSQAQQSSCVSCNRVNNPLERTDRASFIQIAISVCQISRFKFRAACVIGFRTWLVLVIHYIHLFSVNGHWSRVLVQQGTCWSCSNFCN